MPIAFAFSVYAQNKQSSTAIEPTAGEWRTWVISSGKDYRVPPPPAPPDTRAELRNLAELISHNDEQTAAQIAYWDAGGPRVPVDRLHLEPAAGGNGDNGVSPSRLHLRRSCHVRRDDRDVGVEVLLSAVSAERARSQATRQRWTCPTARRIHPNTRQPRRLRPACSPTSFRTRPRTFRRWPIRRDGRGCWRESSSRATTMPESTWARRSPSEVIAKAKADGSDAVWTGSVPTGPCYWKGTNPGNVTAAGWTPLLLLERPSQFRPPAPPACDSAQVQAETATVRNTPRGPTAFATNYKAFYWQSPEGLNYWPFRYLDKWMFEDRLDKNPPRAARAYALVTGVLFDAFIASQDGKFAYWYIRPSQLDPGDRAAVPGTPTSRAIRRIIRRSRRHGARCLRISSRRGPTTSERSAKEGGDSRIWAGIHYPMDNEAGVALGKSVAGVFIDWAKHDGSQ